MGSCGLKQVAGLYWIGLGFPRVPPSILPFSVDILVNLWIHMDMGPYPLTSNYNPGSPFSSKDIHVTLYIHDTLLKTAAPRTNVHKNILQAGHLGTQWGRGACGPRVSGKEPQGTICAYEDHCIC